VNGLQIAQFRNSHVIVYGVEVLFVLEIQFLWILIQ